MVVFAMHIKFTVGVIAEDDSDVDAVYVLLSRLNGGIPFKRLRVATFGCGRLRGKLTVYTSMLKEKGCNRLIVLHDRDKCCEADLRAELERSLSSCPIEMKTVVIPVAEIEAWLLSDIGAIKDFFSLKKDPKPIACPERIDSPKEYLGRLVYSLSGKRQRYLSTRHNKELIAETNLTKLESACPSSRRLIEFGRAMR